MKPDALRKLSAAGLDAEQLAVVMEIMDDDAEDRRAKGRARWRKHQENKKNANVSSLQATFTANSRAGDAPVEDKPLTQKIEPQQEERNALTREFDLFWTEFPNKVGKPKAKGSFLAARKRASQDAIMTGLRRYVASKPADRAWMNPATFLNQDRWDDQPASVVPMARAGPANPGLAAVDRLLEQMDAVSPSQTEADTSYPRLVAFPGGR